MSFYLIRHGETEWNHSKKIQGWQDVDLNDRGLLQAEKLAKHFENHHIDVIYSSDLKRAYKTSEVLSNLKHHEIISEPLLREINFGDWEGKTWKEIQFANQEFFAKGGLNQFDSAIHHGESLNQFKKRAVDHFYFLVEKHLTEDVYIFTHGGNIRMIVLDILDLPLKTEDPLLIDNASITIVAFNQISKKLEVVSVNDTSHLNEVK
jgi:broad specificity phosphatase PhoE